MNKNETKNWLTCRVAEIIGILPAAVDPGRPFSSFGLDSVRLSALAAEVEQATGRQINPAELFEHPTIDMFTDYLCREESPGSRATGGGCEPVAIVGIACRLPGAGDKDRFWELLEEGRDAISEVPAERWNVDELYSANPRALGRTASKWGGFLKDVSEFDNRFFHISSDEAVRMDPQQRQLLEVCWEALEDAGEIPARLRGTMVGVFVGISGSEYVHRQLEHREAIGPYMVSGNALAIAANRLSYVFDFRGPSLAVDTACSSSLVAAHLACRAIAGGECDRAVVAGVNLLLDPEITIGLSKAGMLAPDGRCKPFDAKASGYVRGEGVGVIVLKPLSAARAAQDRIYAVVRGSAINQDGSTNGLTAPNPAAQREVLRLAYDRAGVRPQDVDYVECHGTGTFLGDPIEARSLGTVLGKGRSQDRPCYIGSVKSNIGHLEAAAGMAALIKTALALRLAKLPPSLHFSEPNPHIAFDELGLKVVDHAMEWPSPSGLRLAGVSSFGFGGTNAHLVLESAEDQEQSSALPAGIIVPLSAVSRYSLQRLVQAWRERLDEAPEEEIPRLAQVACLRRTHHRPFRVAVVGETPGDLRRRMADVENDFDRVLDLARAVPAGTPRVGFVFSGQGAQFPGMARELLEASSLFRSLIHNHDAIGRHEFGWSIEAALRGEGALSMDDSAIAQPLLLSIQLALVKVWAAHGIEPAAVLGHSLGEVAAAVTAGVLDVRTAFRLASRRGQLMNLTSRGGCMLAIGMDRVGANALVERFSDSVSLAAENSHRGCVLAGEREALERIAGELASQQVPAQWLPVDYAFHSRSMDPVRIALAQEFAGLVPQPAALPIYSTVLGKNADFTEFNAEYWGRGVRDTVEFVAAIEDLLRDGVDALVELGPQPVLRGPLRSLAGTVTPRPAVLASMERDRNQRSTLLESLAGLYGLGCSVRWSPLFPDGGRMQPLPAYCWDHERFWMERKKPGSGPAHFLLGAEIEADAPRQIFRWENNFDIEQYPYLKDHRVRGQTVFPATGFIEMARAASLQAGLQDPLHITNLTVHRPLLLGETGTRVRTDLVGSGEAGVHRFAVSIASAPAAADTEWTLHLTGEVQPADAHGLPVAEHREMENPTPVPVENFYSMMARQGFEYGDNFRKLAALWRGAGEATGDLDHSNGAASGAERVCLMDSALQLIAAAVPAEVRQSADGLLPYAAESVVFSSGTESLARAHARIRSAETGRIVGDVTVFDDQARARVQVHGLQLRSSRAAEDRSTEQAASNDGLNLYETVWRERPATPAAHAEAHRAWLILSDRLGFGDALAEELRKKGVAAFLCRPGERFGSISRERLQIDPRRSDDYRRMLERVLEDWGSLVGVVHLWAIDQATTGDPDAETTSIARESVLHLLKALSFSSGGAGVRMLVATRGCQPVSGNGTAVVDPAAATIWGLVKTAPVENPLLPLACVDLDPLSDAGLGDLLNEMFSEASDLEVAYRDGKRFVRRITMSGSVTTAACGLPLRADSFYIITGGTGSLGLQVAEFLAQQGARHLALIARNAGQFVEHPALKKLRAAEVEVGLYASDVSNGAMLEKTLAAVRSRGLPIRGVVHAAGIREDGALLDMTPESLDRVAAPKVRGTWNLHRSTLQDPLDWFVLFSSAAGVLGSPGQANYSSANAFLDAFAHYRHGLGLPALAIDWGPWGGAGMASGLQETGEARRLRTGASVIDPAQGLALLGRLLQSKRTQVVALPFDLTNLLQFYPAKIGMSFFEELATPEVRMLKSTGTQRSARPDISTEYLPPRNDIERRITVIWQRSLAIEPVGVLDSFFELGGDSVFANQMIVEVNRSLGVSIEPQRAFERLTVAHLAELAQEQAIEALQNMTEADAASLLGQNTTPIPLQSH